MRKIRPSAASVPLWLPLIHHAFPHQFIWLLNCEALVLGGELSLELKL